MGNGRRLNAKKANSEIKDQQNVKFLADTTLRPSVNAAAVIEEYGKTFGDQDIGELIISLSSSINDVNLGDMKRCEGMLLGQAFALQSIFMNLSRRANTQKYMNNLETFLKLALKAQSQCRTTLETLATIKNPAVIYAKQANISGGHQQVINGMPEPVTLLGENKNLPNELLEDSYASAILDTGTTETPGTENKTVEAVE
jgi:hypothetical protein